MKEVIRSLLIELGASQCGFASAEAFDGAPEGFRPTDVFPRCRSVVAFSLVLPPALAGLNPRILYKHFTDVSLAEVDRITALACTRLSAMGVEAVPVPCDGPYEYWDAARTEGRGLISMRHAALLAGIGCMGKNTLIMNRKFGNMMQLGALLIDLPLASDPPAESLCPPNCRVCLDACPVGALDGKTVDQFKCRPQAYTTNARGFDVCNCNRCRVACPRSRPQTQTVANEC